MQNHITLVFALLFTANLFAQHELPQPFEELGVKVKVLTLSKGKFCEFFPNDTIFRFGSVLFNHITGEVESVVFDDTLYGEYNLKPDVVSRWLSPDPLGGLYPNFSPYNYAMDNPVKYLDSDGRLIVDGDGNIVVTANGTKTVLVEELPSYLKNGYSIHKTVEATYNQVTLYTNNGTPIQALEYVSSREIAVVTDPNTGQLIDRIEISLQKNLDPQSNCFGFAMCDSKFLINEPSEVNKLIENDYQNADKSSAGIAILNDKGGDPLHAAIVNADGTYSDKGGYNKPQYNVDFDKVQAGIGGFTPPEKYSSRCADNVVKTTLGSEKNGVRKIDAPEEIKQFLDQIKSQ